MINRWQRGAIFVAFFLLIGLRPAHAQLLLNFNPADQTGSPGDTVLFTATLLNAGTNVLFLNGAGFAGLGEGLTPDISPFFNNSPLFLAGGEQWTGDVFTIAISSSASPGIFFGTFRVLGGTSDTDQAPIASQNFLVAVSAPEPGTMALVLPVLLGGLLVGRRGIRRR